MPADAVVEGLDCMGIRSFYQEGISLTGPHWQSQWFKAATEAKVCCQLLLFSARR